MQHNNRRANDALICIVIPVHNRIELTKLCLASLKEQSFKHFCIVLVDDGSTDGTAETIRRLHPDVHILHGDGHLWWTAAVNRGVRWALRPENHFDFVLTLNNDTVCSSTYLEELLNLASSHHHALIGSTSLSDEARDEVVEAGVRVNYLTGKYSPLHAHTSYKDLLSLNESFGETDVLSGRGTLIPLSAFREVGLYDEVRLPHYGADYEFSVRARKHGFSLLVSYRAHLISRIRETGLKNEHMALAWSDLGASFFSIRSPNNLRYRWNYARLVCPWILLPTFFLFDVTRLVLGALRNQLTRDSAIPSHHNEATS